LQPGAAKRASDWVRAMNGLQLLVFMLASAGLGWASRRALRRTGAHGFYRFWAWEALLALIVLQAPRWFRNLFRPRQLLSWLLLGLSLVPLALGLRLLRRAGRPSSDRQDPALLGMEKTTELVTSGVYRYIRHPLYASLLLLAWGAFFKAPGWRAGILTGMASALLFATARIEERENTGFFGPAYEAYMHGTRRFIPYVF
jgi:protein-S-isoprenylcysteine O-methyltransferase Ste14